MNWTYWEWALLALMMWREARNQGELGMRATGHVAWNRRFETGSPLGNVITADAQFTSINPFRKTYDPQLDVWPLHGDPAFDLAMKIANEIQAETSSDPTGGATSYRNLQTATSESFQKAVETGELVKTVSVGEHEFYRRKTVHT